MFRVTGEGSLEAKALPRHTSLHAVIVRFGGPGSLDPGVWDAVGKDMAEDLLRSGGVDAARQPRTRKDDG